MPEVSESARLKLDADAAWRRIGDFGAVGEWHPLLAKVESEGNAPGALRHVETTDGDRQVERLEAYDPDLHVYHYSLQETGLPVRNYAGEFRVSEAAGGESVVTWSARFDVSEGDASQGVETVDQFIRAGTAALAKRYG